MCKKIYIWSPSACTCEKGKFLGSIIGDAVFMDDKIIELTKAIPTKTISKNFNEKKVKCKIENFYISITFLTITIAVLLAVSIYCYLMKHRSKQEHLLSYYGTSNDLREIDFNNLI